MSRNCIVHIGPAKTGSSSIQQTLFKALADPAFEYAQLGVTNHNMRLCTLYSQSPEKFDHHVQRGQVETRVERKKLKARESFDHALAVATAPAVIFSGESIASLADNELTAMRDDLLTHFDTVTVVGYVRPPRATMQSAYQQRIKSKFTPLATPSLYPHYRRKFEKLDTIFGRENVKLWRFAAEDFPDGDVVRHFFNALGIAAPLTIHRVNESLSKPAVQALFAFHRFTEGFGVGPRIPRQKKALFAALAEVPGEKFQFATALTDPVIAANLDDISWAEQRIGASLAEPARDETGAIASRDDMLEISEAGIAALEACVAARTAVPKRAPKAARHAANLVASLMDSLQHASTADLEEEAA